MVEKTSIVRPVRKKKEKKRKEKMEGRRVLKKRWVRRRRMG